MTAQKDFSNISFFNHTKFSFGIAIVFYALTMSQSKTLSETKSVSHRSRPQLSTRLLRHLLIRGGRVTGPQATSSTIVSEVRRISSECCEDVLGPKLGL